MRPGEFQMLDKDQNITNELDKCQAIIFKGEDADGNRAVRDENRISYSNWGGSALNILNSGLTRLYFRAPIGMLEYGVDIDCYSLWWQELDAGATRTSTFTKFTNARSSTCSALTCSSDEGVQPGEVSAVVVGWFVGLASITVHLRDGDVRLCQSTANSQNGLPDLADNYSKFVQTTLGAVLGLLAGSATQRRPSSSDPDVSGFTTSSTASAAF